MDPCAEKEFAVRRLVGASERQNHILLLKRFSGIWAGAYILGIMVSGILLYILSKIENLQSTRRLLGISLDMSSCSGGKCCIFNRVCSNGNMQTGRKRRETMLGLRRDKI